MTRVFLVDDNAFIRKIMKKLIELENDFQVCGQAECAEEALEALTYLTVDVILIDISLNGGEEGIQLIKDIRAKGLQTPILTISLHEEAVYADRVLEAGGQGYLMKQEASTHLIKAIHFLMEEPGGFFKVGFNINRYLSPS